MGNYTLILTEMDYRSVLIHISIFTKKIAANTWHNSLQVMTIVVWAGDDGSSHSYDLYLSQSPAEGEYLLAVGNYTFSSANALSGRNSAGSYPNGGAYQATFNQEMNFIEYPENANINLYGSDHYNFYVLNNDLDPYSVAGLRILNPVIVDENGTESVFAGACRK